MRTETLPVGFGELMDLPSGERQPDLEKSPATRRVADGHSPVVPINNILDEVQPQPAALIERDDAAERLEDGFAMLFGDAGPRVGNAKRAITSNRDVDRGPAAPMDHGVLDEIDQRA